MADTAPVTALFMDDIAVLMETTYPNGVRSRELAIHGVHVAQQMIRADGTPQAIHFTSFTISCHELASVRKAADHFASEQVPR